MGEGVGGRVEINKITISDVSHFIADDIRPETLFRPCAIFLHNIFPYYTLYFSYIRLRFERKIKLVHKYNYRIKS